VDAVGTSVQIHDPGLLRVQTELESLSRPLEPSLSLLRVGLGPTQEQGIIRVTDDGAETAGLLLPKGVEDMAVDVAEQRRDCSALRNWNAGRYGDRHAVLHDAGAHPLSDQPEHPPVADSAGHQA